MLKTVILVISISLVSFYAIGCGQAEPGPDVTIPQELPTQVTAATPTQVATPTPTKVAPTMPPTATQVPKPTATSVPSPTPTATQVPKPTATSVPSPSPTPTATPVPPTPTATPIPPTATPSPVPTPTPSATTLDSFGFKLVIDGVITIENTGFTSAEANNNDGIVYFEYEGANSTLLWFEDSSSKLEDVMFDTYNSFTEANQNLSFTLINQGEMDVESFQGKFLTYVSADAEGIDQGGGLTGTWRCQANEPRKTPTVFSLTVTGADPVVLQIRFKRLIDNFNCIP